MTDIEKYKQKELSKKIYNQEYYKKITKPKLEIQKLELSDLKKEIDDIKKTISPDIHKQYNDILTLNEKYITENQNLKNLLYETRIKYTALLDICQNHISSNILNQHL